MKELRLVSNRRSESSHVAVLSAAVEIAGLRGYGGAKVEDIAAEAGVGKPTIYRWWPNKAALFIEAYCKLVPSDIAAEDTGSLAGDLDSFLGRLYGGTAASDILSRLIAEAQADPVLARHLREAYVAPRREILRSIVIRADHRGEIPMPANADFISDLFSSAVWFRLLLDERELSEDFRHQFVNTPVCLATMPDVASKSAS
jgi:AcrR family transcriptional regulator